MKTQISVQLYSKMRQVDAATAGRIWQTLQQYRENPAHPGLRLERLTGSRDNNIWSIRVSREYRLIIHKKGDLTTFLYADRHDEAYRWAETHYVGTNNITGAMEVIEVHERVEERVRAIKVEPEAEPIFRRHSQDYLLRLGIPKEYLRMVREEIRSEEQLIEIADKLPSEVGNRLLRLADGEVVTPPSVIPDTAPEDHPDARAQFHPLTEDTDLEKLLEAPFDSWLVFLHPSQRRVAYGDFNGPIKVTGTAGTGKTVAALHRAYHLARQGENVFFCTYVKVLAQNLERSLDLLCKGHPEVRRRIHISTVHSEAMNFTTGLRVVADDDIRKWIQRAPLRHTCSLSDDAIFSEWKYVVEAQGIKDWEGYRNANRTGLGKSLQTTERKKVWNVISYIFNQFGTRAGSYSFIAGQAAENLESGEVSSPYSAVVIDEAQDLGLQEIRFLRCLAPNNLSLFGDSGQRIYSRAFSFTSLGVEVRGRSFTLQVNYRTTSEIRRFADKLRNKETDDMSGGKESRTRVVSLLTGNDPEVQSFPSRSAEIKWVAEKIALHLKNGEAPETIAVLARSQNELKGYSGGLSQGQGIPVNWMKQNQRIEKGKVNLCTMHGSKGLEFRIVFVVDVNEDILPFPRALEGINDSVLRQEACDRERNLLYVSCTRARDFLTVTYAKQPSAFLGPVL